MYYARRFLLSTNSTSPLPVTSPPPETEESEFIVILAALICAIICVFGLIAVARCTWLRRRISPAGTNSSAGHPAANKGLRKKVLNSLPKYTYNSSSKSVAVNSTESEDCAICLTEYADGDEIRVLPQCGHGFHVQCIDTWLGSHSSCPSCRQVLVVSRCRKCWEFDSTTANDGEDGSGSGGRSLKFTKLKLFSSAASTSSPTYLP